CNPTLRRLQRTAITPTQSLPASRAPKRSSPRGRRERSRGSCTSPAARCASRSRRRRRASRCCCVTATAPCCRISRRRGRSRSRREVAGVAA
ncbi:MAG: hypothetical protein AVDCRST_MAG67-3027, partial [uncultured Solirubrobacteraceae bacterium]